MSESFEHVWPLMNIQWHKWRVKSMASCRANV